MAVSAAAVRVGKPLNTGGILTAPLGTALPTDTVAALNVAFLASGYAGEDGLVQTIDTDATDIKAWGGDIVRTVQTSHKLTYQFTLIEHGAVTLAAYYGSANTTGSTVAKIVSGDLPHAAWVFEIRDGAVKIRIVVPDGNITDRGDVEYKDDGAVQYPVTLTCYPDATNVKSYIYTA